MLALNAEEREFANEVREWVRSVYAPERRARIEANPEYRSTRDDHIWWQRQLYDRGWLIPHWPIEHGGLGWSARRVHLFRSILADENVPDFAGAGLELLGPVLMAYGTDKQKRRYLDDLLAARTWWAQGYSEPDAGSDLAALSTRAKRDGDHYIVDGTKVWTTAAHKADAIFCLVRTSRGERKQQGISFLLIDLDQPGIEVRPIITLDGWPAGHHEINQVIFQDVKVPVANRLGAEGEGWACAKYLLQFERGNPVAPNLRRRLQELRRLATSISAPQGCKLDDAVFSHRLASLEIAVTALEATELRGLQLAQYGGEMPGLASHLKARGTEYDQRIDELAMDIVGARGLVFAPPGGRAAGLPFADRGLIAARYFNGRKKSIYGGTNEIQRNIIAKTVLGLP